MQSPLGSFSVILSSLATAFDAPIAAAGNAGLVDGEIPTGTKTGAEALKDEELLKLMIVSSQLFVF